MRVCCNHTWTAGYSFMATFIRRWMNTPIVFFGPDNSEKLWALFLWWTGEFSLACWDERNQWDMIKNSKGYRCAGSVLHQRLCMIDPRGSKKLHTFCRNLGPLASMLAWLVPSHKIVSFMIHIFQGRALFIDQNQLKVGNQRIVTTLIENRNR